MGIEMGRMGNTELRYNTEKMARQGDYKPARAKETSRTKRQLTRPVKRNCFINKNSNNTNEPFMPYIQGELCQITNSYSFAKKTITITRRRYFSGTSRRVVWTFLVTGTFSG